MGDTGLDEETIDEYLDGLRDHYRADKVRRQMKRFLRGDREADYRPYRRSITFLVNKFSSLR